MRDPEPRLVIGEAARFLGLSTARVRQLDDELRPEFIGERKFRVYRLDAVEAYARKRSGR